MPRGLLRFSRQLTFRKRRDGEGPVGPFWSGPEYYPEDRTSFHILPAFLTQIPAAASPYVSLALGLTSPVRPPH